MAKGSLKKQDGSEFTLDDFILDWSGERQQPAGKTPAQIWQQLQMITEFQTGLNQA